MARIDAGGTLKYAAGMVLFCRDAVTLLAAAAVALSLGTTDARADMGRVGKSHKVFSIREEAENKRIRDQVERVLTMRERKAEAAAAKAALETQRNEAEAAPATNMRGADCLQRQHARDAKNGHVSRKRNAASITLPHREGQAKRHKAKNPKATPQAAMASWCAPIGRKTVQGHVKLGVRVKLF
jgi:Mg-chelatase subunit ChlI